MLPDIRVAFVGDSFTAGVGDDLALGWVGRVVARARAAGWDVTGYNLGIRRETSVDIQERLVAEARPRLRDGDVHGLVVSAGVNDTTIVAGERRVGVRGTLAALDRTMDDAAVARWPLFVVGPALVGDAEQNARIVALSRSMAETCGERGVCYVEVAASLLGDEAWLAEVTSLDGAHPRAPGYERLADLVWPTFRQWLDRLAATAPPAG